MKYNIKNNILFVLSYIYRYNCLATYNINNGAYLKVLKNSTNKLKGGKHADGLQNISKCKRRFKLVELNYIYNIKKVRNFKVAYAPYALKPIYYTCTDQVTVENI